MASQTPDYLSIARGGLQPGGGAARKVIVVGAGMAGLVSGYELLRAGHDVTILKVRQRVGERVYTMRDPFTKGLHGQAGAMRISRSCALRKGAYTWPASALRSPIARSRGPSNRPCAWRSRSTMRLRSPEALATLAEQHKRI